jgi:hypothetical protein
MITWVEDVKAHFHTKYEVYGSWEGKLPRSKFIFSFKKLTFELFELKVWKIKIILFGSWFWKQPLIWVL